MINEIFKKYGTKLSFHDNRKADENVLEQAIKETARVVLDNITEGYNEHDNSYYSFNNILYAISQLRKETE